MLRVDIERRIGDFELRPAFDAGSELVVLFGPSGCGKSLTLKAIAGLLAPDRGRIEAAGRVLFDAEQRINLPPQERGVGYVVQELALFPHLTAIDNIEFGLASWPREGRRARSQGLIDMMGLKGLEHRKPAQLSGGQQQRVALARALAPEPRLLLLDEPFSGLEAGLRATLRHELSQLQRRLDVTTIFVTHDLAETYALADRVVVMDDGIVMQQGTREEVLQRPASRRVAELADVRNIIPGEIVGYAEGVAVVRTPWFTARVGGTAVPRHGSVFVCIRPEHVLLLREGREARDAGDAVVEAEIVQETALGNTHRLIMRAQADELGSPLMLEVDVPAHPYELLGVASQRSWRVALTASHMCLVPRD